MIRYLLSLSLTLGLLGFTSAGLAAISDAEAVNRAGMQRMLSQRIAKNYLMLGTETRAEVAIVQFDQSIADLESNSQLLEDYASTATIGTALTRANETWHRYREVVLTPPSKERAVEVLQLSEQALEQNEKLVRLIEQYTGSQTANLVNRSGRQRMLSQRIAKLYLAMAWHLPSPQLQGAFNTAVKEFDEGLMYLRQAPQNTPEINRRLDQVATQWRFAQAGFNLANNSQFVPTVIVSTTETLLVKMDELTRLYEALADAH